jgi:hypothetical protein
LSVETAAARADDVNGEDGSGEWATGLFSFPGAGTARRGEQGLLFPCDESVELHAEKDDLILITSTSSASSPGRSSSSGSHRAAAGVPLVIGLLDASSLALTVVACEALAGMWWAMAGAVGLRTTAGTDAVNDCSSDGESDDGIGAWGMRVVLMCDCPALSAAGAQWLVVREVRYALAWAR